MKESMLATYWTEDPEYINLKNTNESRKQTNRQKRPWI